MFQIEFIETQRALKHWGFVSGKPLARAEEHALTSLSIQQILVISLGLLGGGLLHTVVSPTFENVALLRRRTDLGVDEMFLCVTKCVKTQEMRKMTQTLKSLVQFLTKDAFLFSCQPLTLAHQQKRSQGCQILLEGTPKGRDHERSYMHKTNLVNHSY